VVEISLCSDDTDEPSGRRVEVLAPAAPLGGSASWQQLSLSPRTDEGADEDDSDGGPDSDEEDVPAVPSSVLRLTRVPPTSR